MTQTTFHLPPPAPSLSQDLSLILPDIAEGGGPATCHVAAAIGGKRVELAQAIEEMVQLIDRSAAPAIVGLADCTLEAIHQSVLLAQKIRGRLLPWPTLGSNINVTQSASYWATLSEACACDFVIRPANDPASAEHPVMAAIMQHTLHSMFVESDLAAVQRLRAAVARRGVAAIHDVIMKPVRRICVVLYAHTAPEVVSQWHRLANDIQFDLRLSVLVLPNMATHFNSRGVSEVITWLTGVCPIAGGVDFTDAKPRGCNHAAKVLAGRSCDLIIELGLAPGCDLARPADIDRIHIGREFDEQAKISIAVPGLLPGLAGRVMRFDGTIMWLCDQHATGENAPADPFVGIIASVINRCAG